MTSAATRHLIAAVAVAVLAPAAALALVTFAPASSTLHRLTARPAAPIDRVMAEFEVRDSFIAAVKAQQCTTDQECVAQCLPTARTAAEREFCFAF